MHNVNTYIGRQSAWHTLGTVTGKYLEDKVNGRKDKATFLGAVGKDYAVIQHDEGFKSIDAPRQ